MLLIFLGCIEQVVIIQQVNKWGKVQHLHEQPIRRDSGFNWVVRQEVVCLVHWRGEWPVTEPERRENWRYAPLPTNVIFVKKCVFSSNAYSVPYLETKVSRESFNDLVSAHIFDSPAPQIAAMIVSMYLFSHLDEKVSWSCSSQPAEAVDPDAVLLFAATYLTLPVEV